MSSPTTLAGYWPGSGYGLPLDEFFVDPLGYGRESRVLRLLSDATIILSPYKPETLVGPRLGEGTASAPWPGESGRAPRPARSGRRTPRPGR